MLRSAWVVIAAVLLLTSFGVCQKQGHFDASFNSALIFTRSSDANAVQQSATIGANYFGTFRFRLNKKSKNSLIFNFGYAKNSQVYQTNFNYHQLDTIHEYNSTYVRHIYKKGKIQP